MAARILYLRLNRRLKFSAASLVTPRVVCAPFLRHIEACAPACSRCSWLASYRGRAPAPAAGRTAPARRRARANFLYAYA